MKTTAYLLGFSCIAYCSAIILYTRETIKLLRNLYQRYPLTYLAAIPAIFAVLFLVAAPATTYAWLFRILGFLAIAEALVAFFNPKNIYRQMLDWYFDRVSDQTQRLFGIIGVIFGTVILTWIR